MYENSNNLTSGFATKLRQLALRSLLLAALVISLSPTPPALAASLVVDSTGDQPDVNPGDGICKIAGPNQCTLRAAIQEANALAGPDMISFNLGTATIAPLTLLPALSDNGTTISADGLITLDGSPGGIATGLQINHSNYNKIQGLRLENFDTAIFIFGLFPGTAQDNVIGTDGDGNNDNSESNLINGNTVGVSILGGTAEDDGSASGNRIAGNRIGTNPSGTAAAPNEIGIRITNGEYNTIGTNADGQSDVVERNLISGNSDTGLLLDGTSKNNGVFGNYIGTTADGAAALGNGNIGVSITSPLINSIGWLGNCDPVTEACAATTRNVISANGSNAGVFPGIGLLLDGSNHTLVASNYIGTNAAGTAALGNSQIGIVLANGASANGIGAEGYNRNIISGNTIGILIEGSGPGNKIFGNYIGTNAVGNAALGNLSSGIRITGASSGNSIGSDAGQGNKIAFNGLFGVEVAPEADANAILSNTIYSNGLLGINLDSGNPAPFVTPNDFGDSDGGANDLMNFPVNISTSTSGSFVIVQGSINSGLPDTPFKVQFFANATCDPSGYGEGQTFLGQTTVTTNGSGNASFQMSFIKKGVPVGYNITTTATPYFSTDPYYGPNYDGTSEFSACNALQQFTLKGLVNNPWPYFYFYKGDPAPDTFNLVVDGPDGNVSDQWYRTADICFDDICAVGLDVALREASYSWRLRSSTGGREGKFGQSYAFIVDLTPPEAPGLRSPDDGASLASTRAHFSWAKLPEALRYHIEVATDREFNHLVIDEVSDNTQFKPSKDQALAGGVTYYWQVQVQDEAGNWGSFSAPFTLMVER